MYTLKETFLEGWGIGQKGVQDLISDMSFKSIFNIHILRDIQRIGDEGYRGVQDLISDMSLKSVFINFTTSKE